MTYRPSLPTVRDGVPDGGRSPAAVARHFGRFQVTGMLGAGGMGVVLAAYDPDLDRQVAIKVLHPEARATERLALEARAMARLAHPNVVTVFEVGVLDGRTFIVMELVEGTNLRAWSTQPHTWREIVTTFVGAGRGLAAAHGADLIHRDFKPDNVLIGSDGRPRVGDFGLVTAVGGEGTSEPHAALDETIDPTASRAFMGTPAYMAPEQWQRQHVGPYSDQFAFCVALWEALYGERPFAGAGTVELGRAIALGLVREPARRGSAPRWLEVALRRGLSVAPDRRWPTMDELLVVLKRGSRPRRVWIPMMSAAVAALAVAAIAMAARPEAAPVCALPSARLAAVWSRERHAALDQHLARVDRSRGAGRAALVSARFEHYLDEWSGSYVETCRATRVDGRQSDTVFDRRMACLDRAILELEQTVVVVERSTSAAEVDSAMVAIAGLPPVDTCADTATLDAPVALPLGPAARSELKEIERELAELTVARRAGKLARGRAQDLVARARKVGFAPRLAGALDLLVGDLLDSDDGESAVIALRELALVAATGHEDWIAARAWVRLLRVQAELRKPAEAGAVLPMATAAVARAGNPPELRYDLLEGESSLAQLAGELPRARALVEEGLGLLERAGAGSPGRDAVTERLSAAVFNLGVLLTLERRFVDAVPVLQRARELRAGLFGEDHGDLARIHQALGDALRQAGRRDEALEAWRQAARIAEERLPPSPLRAVLVTRVGSLLAELGRASDGLPYLERGVAMAKQAFPPESQTLALLIADLGVGLHGVGRDAEAREALSGTLRLLEREAPSTNLAITLYNLGDLEADTGDCIAAEPHLRRSLAVFEKLLGPETPLGAYPLVRIARCDLERHRWQHALDAAARVLSRPVGSVEPETWLHARYVRGRARYESGRDRPDGLAEVEDVAAALAGHEGVDGLDVHAWLATRRSSLRR